MDSYTKLLLEVSELILGEDISLSEPISETYNKLWEYKKKLIENKGYNNENTKYVESVK